MAKKKEEIKTNIKTETKSNVSQPKMSVQAKEKTSTETKRSEIVYKKEEKIENLFQALGEIERTIQELSRIYAELPDSGHKGVSGNLKPTLKQEVISAQIGEAKARAERLIRLIEGLQK